MAAELISGKLQPPSEGDEPEIGKAVVVAKDGNKIGIYKDKAEMWQRKRPTAT